MSAENECASCDHVGPLRYGVQDTANNVYVAVCSLECVMWAAVDAMRIQTEDETRDADRVNYADWRRNNTGWAALLPGRMKHPSRLTP